MPIFGAIGRSVFDALFPLRCIGCGKEDTLLCPVCLAAMQPIEEPFCHRCGKPLRPGHHHVAGKIDGIRSIFYYQGVARQAVLSLKYRNWKCLGAPLGGLLAEKISDLPPCDAMVPVPLHHQRIRQRGYNQSSLVAREAARLSGVALVEGPLVRWRDTPPQARTTSREEREAHMRGAFRCSDRRLEGKRVIVVDDVCTTGATLRACAEALKDSGAAAVWGLTLCAEA
ncbi:MAG: ComF family protein [Chloroflexi bacterium]|nr:ComF family protein [Chloroflexota bacterium]